MRFHANAVVLCCALLCASQADAQNAKWTVDAKPVMAIGAAGDGRTAEFAFVNGVTRLPDGNVMVSDRSDYSMLIVSPTGKIVKRFGRAGSGPGELTNPFFSWACGKQVFIGNNANTSMSVFDADGAYVRSYRIGSGIGKQGAYRSACNKDGLFVHYGWDNSKGQRPGIPFRAPVPVWVAAGDSSSGKLIATVQGSERVNGGPLPLGRETRIAIGTDRIYVGEADAYEIKVFTLDGNPLPAIVKKSAKAVAVTKQDIADDVDRVLAIMGVKFRKSVEEEYESIRMPRTLPPYRELLVDSEQNLWVRDYARSGPVNVLWTVFSKAGKQITEIALPNALEVYEIGKDYVLGRYIDPDAGAPEVRMYRLRTSGK